MTLPHHRDLLKSNKNPNYSAEAQVVALVIECMLSHWVMINAPVKTSFIIITRKFCLIWEISEVQDVEGFEPEPGVMS